MSNLNYLLTYYNKNNFLFTVYVLLKHAHFVVTVVAFLLLYQINTYITYLATLSVFIDFCFRQPAQGNICIGG